MSRRRLPCLLATLGLPVLAAANGVDEIPEHQPPPAPPEPPCCYLERQLEYEKALQGAWLCTLATGPAHTRDGKVADAKFDDGDAVVPDRSCWHFSFDSACAGVIFHSYRPIPAVLGPHLQLQRSASWIAFLEKKLENCDASPDRDHPLLQYCTQYCNAPENFGHSAPQGTTSQRPRD